MIFSSYRCLFLSILMPLNYRPLVKSAVTEKEFSYFSTKTYVVGT